MKLDFGPVKMRLCIFCAIFYVVSGCNSSNPSSPAAYGSKELLTSSDSGLLCAAYCAVLMELYIAEEAKTRSALRETKEFANALFTNYTKLKDILIAFSKTQSIDLPLDISEFQKNNWKKLIKKKGKKFDEYFIELVIADQEEALQIFTKLSTEANNASLRQIGSNFIQYSNNHLQEAKNLQNSLKNRVKISSS